MKKRLILLVLLMLAVAFSGCLNIGSSKDKAAITQKMEAYFAEDLEGFRQLDFGYDEETFDDEAFMADLEKLLGYYGDRFSLSIREKREHREIELAPQDLSVDLFNSRNFSKELFLSYDPEQSRVLDYLAEVLSEGHMTLFFMWGDLHRADLEEYILERLAWMAEGSEARETAEPQVHDPVIEVQGKSGKYTMAYSVTWVDRLLGATTEYPGKATILVEFVLEKTTQWNIVAVNQVMMMDMDVPVDSEFYR